MKVSDAVSGSATLALGLGVAAYAQTFPPMPGQPVGPGLFPTVVGLGLAMFGLGLLVAARGHEARPAVEAATWMRHPHLVRNFLLVVADLVFYAVAVEPLGFLITSVAFLAVLMRAFGVTWRRIAPLAIVVTLIVHTGFYSMLRVPLPWGLLEGVAW